MSLLEAPSIVGPPAPRFGPTPEPVPFFGLGDYRSQVQAITGLGARPLAINTPASAAGGAQMLSTLQRTALYTGGAVGPDNDPNQWTPEEAAGQTDRALARIAQVNPELAQELAAKRGQTDDGPGFFGSIWDGITSLGAGLLELIDRPSHIIPEIIMSDDPWWKDIGDALSGNSDARWKDVLIEKAGWEEGWLTSVVGFVGDVATDPLTYATFGAGGIARTASMRLAGEKGLAQLLKNGTYRPVLEQAMKAAPDVIKNADDAARVLLTQTQVAQEIANKASGSILARIRGAANQVHPDAAGGVIASLTENVDGIVLRELLQKGDDLMRAVSQTGFRRLDKATLARLGFDKDMLVSELKAMQRAGNVAAMPLTLASRTAKATYQQGRLAGSLLGGVRLRVPLPMLGFRMQTGNLLPFAHKLDFQPFRRFFAGASGSKRLLRLVGKGEVPMEHLKAYWEGGLTGKTIREGNGWKHVPGLKQVAPATYKRLAQGHGHLGSIFYPLSDMVGGITANFAPSAAILRGGGWAAKQASDSRKAAIHVREQLTDASWEFVEDGGRVVPRREVQHTVVRAMHPQGPKIVDEAREAAMDEYLLTRSFQQGVGQDAESFYSPLIRRAQEAGAVEQAATLRAQRDRAVRAEEALRAFGDENLETAGRYLDSAQRGGDRATLDVGLDGDVHEQTLLEADDIRLEDARRLQEGVHPSVAGHYLEASTPGQMGDTIDYGSIRDTNRTAEGAVVQQVRGVPMRLGRAMDDTNPLVTNITSGEIDELARDLGRPTEGMFAPEGGVAVAEKTAAVAEDVSKWKPGTPVREALESLDEADREVVLEALKKMRGDVANLTERGGMNYVGAPRRPYVQNQARGGAGSTDVVDELEEETKKFIEFEESTRAETFADTEEFTQEIADRTVRESVEDMQAQQVSAFRTKWLQERGFDSLVTITPEGETFVTILAREDGLIPLARVTRDAPHAAGGFRGAARMASDAAEAAVRGIPKFAELPGAGRTWLRQKIRDTARMSKAEAEEYLRSELGKVGVDLPPGASVLEASTYRGMDRYVKRAAHEAAETQLGYAARRLTNLGLATSAFRGGVSGEAMYRFVVNQGNFDAAKRYLGKLYEADARAAHWQADVEIPRLRQVVREQARTMAERQADLQSRMTGLITRMRQSVDPTRQRVIREGLEEDAAAGLAEANAMFKSGKDKAGRQIRTTSVSNNIKRMIDEDGGITYVWVDDKGRVIAVRDVGEELADDAKRLKDPTLDPSDPGWSIRRPVSAYASKQARGLREDLGMSISDALHDAHWNDFGIDDIDKATDAIMAQELSDAGIKLNERAVERLRTRISDAMQAQLSEDSAELAKQQLARSADMAAFNRLLTKSRTAAAPLIPAIQPIENARNFAGMMKVDLPFLGEKAMPAFMAMEFNQAIFGPRGITGLHRHWRQFNNWWKTLATWLWPGFHIRNGMGAFFNGWLQGVDMTDYFTSGRIRKAAWESAHKPQGEWKWFNRKVTTKDADLVAALERAGYRHINGVRVRDITYGDLAAEETGMGITSANGRSFAEPELPGEITEQRVAGQRPIERVPVLKAYPKVMRGAGTLTENVFRTASWVRGIRDYGDMWQARAEVMLRHGDYQDLTDFEYGVIRDILPFYKWMRTNLPYQFHQLLENPAKQLAVIKATESAYELSGRDYNEERYKLPEWLARPGTFPNPFGDQSTSEWDAVSLDLPMADLFLDGREMFSSFLPLVRPLIESYIIEQQVFTGKPLEGTPVQLPAAFDPLSGFLSAMGLAEQGPEGQTFIDDKLQNTLGFIPVFSRFRNFLYEDPDRTKLRAGSLMSMSLGIGIRPVDEEQLTRTELDFYYGQVRPQLEHLQDMGYTLPTTDDLAALGQQTDAVLAGLGITPAVALAA